MPDAKGPAKGRVTRCEGPEGYASAESEAHLELGLALGAKRAQTTLSIVRGIRYPDKMSRVNYIRFISQHETLQHRLARRMVSW